MKIRGALVAGVTFAGLFAQPPIQAQPPAAAVKAAVAAEIDRASAALEAAAPEQERAAPIARLQRARTALEAGRLYLAAYLTEAGWEGAKNWTFVKASSDITTAAAFLKKWTSMGEPRQAARPPAARRPVLVEAIAAVAEARGPITYHASRPYSEDSGLFGGLYYLSDAHAAMQFAALVRGWEWAPAGTPPPLRSIQNEIGALDVEMTTAYETMEKANHPTYISASAALKQARTLNDQGRFDGALFEYLLSRYLFASLRGPAAAPATTELVADARGSFAGPVDHSIAELFLQLADEALAGGSDAQRRNAAGVLEDVIPAYRRALAPASTTTTSAAPAPVTITLVRWPFT
jgi:hypothetical protein